MKTTPHLPRMALRNAAAALLLTLGLVSLEGGTALAANTDIAKAPLFTTGTTVVKPNLMFVLDDSGSMGWDYLPDDAAFGVTPDASGNGVKYGRRAAQCNGVAYNPDPAVVYDPPLDAAGSRRTAGSLAFLSDFNASNLVNKRALSPTLVTMQSSGNLTVTVNVSGRQQSWYPVGTVVTVFNNSLLGGAPYMMGTVVSWNGASSGTGAGRLVIKVGASVGSISSVASATVGNGTPALQMYYEYSGSQPGMNYKYPNNVLQTSSTFYQECSSSIGSAPGSGVFTAQFVTAASAEAQRYANWHQYYRTRMDMMKTSVSKAFSVMDSKFRIGFSTISEKTVAEGADFLDIRDFDNAQKISFYSKLAGATPGGHTPLRAALSKAGRYFARKANNQTYDPVQYSCQKNFTILSTDGYWNTNDETSSYGPDKLDGSTDVGNQDGGATPRPQFDGNVSTATTTQKWTVTTAYQTTTVSPSVKTETSKTVTTKYTATNGESRSNYSLTISSFSISNLTARCTNRPNNQKTCELKIRTSKNHGYTDGQSITLSGISPADYNGTYTIELKNLDEFYVTVNGLNRSVDWPSKDGNSAVAGSNCPVGQGVKYKWTETRQMGTTQTTTSLSAMDTSQDQTVVKGYSSTISYTRTIISVNGVQSSDNTTSTTSTTSPQTISDSVATGTPTATVPQPAQPAAQNGTYGWTAWVAGTAAADGCAATQPAADAATAVTATAPPSVVTDTVTSSTAAGTVSSSTTPTVTTSAVTTTNTSSSSGGSTSSLADVAMYYYQTDLRHADLANCTGSLGNAVCENNVTALGVDGAAWQHMSTYTLSLGNSGSLTYDMDYPTKDSGDYRDIVNGNKNWPVPDDNSGAVNIDDLWHAAVNGRGRYFSAISPSSLATGLNAALSSIQAMVGSASAAATSTLQPVQGDNGAFVAEFRSSEWTGDLKGYALDIRTGAVVTSKLDANGNTVDTKLWSASDSLTSSYARSIYYFRPTGAVSGPGTLQPFDYATMNAAEKASFDGSCSKSPTLSQCTGLSGTPLNQVNSGANLVSFLRGQPQPQFRTPLKLLGDIVNSAPVHVAKPTMAYSENNYAEFKDRLKNRKATVYVGANDGMLHAFNAESTTGAGGALQATDDSGKERWAYIPNLVMPKLYLLGDEFYASRHEYFVDGTPVVADIFDGSKWRTILVGGLNAGGRGYYALDITDPDAPIALWEFVPASMGFSYGNPVIAKRADGTWIVALTSGHNNADGGGHFYLLNAATGALLKQIDTGAGTAGSPSGLSKINAWIDTTTEKLAMRFYGGDLLGNVWRFDIDNRVAPNGAALKLAQLTDANGKAQPITTKPMLAQIDANNGRWPVVFVGTGIYLGKTDVTAAHQQSVYAIKDALADTPLGDVRTQGRLVKQPVDTSVKPRVVGSANSTVDWRENNGWYVDFPGLSERVNVDMLLVGHTLAAAGNMPGTTATDCTAAGNGTSWLYLFNIYGGTKGSGTFGGGMGSGTSGGRMGTGDSYSTMLAGFSPVQLESGEIMLLGQGYNGNVQRPVSAGSLQEGSRNPRRSSWRELID